MTPPLPAGIEALASTGDADALRRSAEADNIAAKAALGYRLLAYPPYSVAEGTLWAVSAANDGSGEAAHLIAVLTATGLGVQQSWPTALIYLQRSAELGYELAQRELMTLAGDAALAEAARSGAYAQDIWWRLRESVDVAAWLKVPPPRMVNTAPRIAVVEGFASAKICDWLIERARPMLKPAAIYDQASGEKRPDPKRTNTDAHFTIPDSDLILLFVRARIAAVTGLPTGAMEATTALHYDVGQIFSHHYDYLDPALPGSTEELAMGGQRLATFLLYMNDGFDAAETDFPHIAWQYKGAKGDAMFFWNVDANGKPDPLTMHAGLPPTRGEKWLLSQWIRARAGLG